MNKEKILEITKGLIDDSQYSTTKDSNRDELVYALGYNDGVLDFCNTLLKALGEVGESE